MRPMRSLPTDATASTDLSPTPSALAARRDALLLAAALLLLRAPGLFYGVVDIDESDFLVNGRMLREGALPYVGLVEKKPFLSYLYYSPASLFGFHMWPMQLLAILWVLATCLVIGRAAALWTRRPEAARLGAWLCLAACCCNALSVNAELMLNLPAAGALYFFVRRERQGRARDDLYTGLCLGAAMLYKHQAGILLLSLSGAVLASAWRRPREGRAAVGLGRLVRMGLGAALPWAAVVALYAALGHLGAFIEWNLVRNFLYAGFGSGSALERGLVGVAVFALLAAPSQWWLAMRATRARLAGKKAPADPIATAVLLSLWAVFIPVCLGGRFYPHYFLQFAPVLALSATPGLLAAWEASGEPAARARRWLRFGLYAPVVVFFAVAIGRGVAGNYPGQEPRARAIGAWLREHTRPDERMFVWGHFTPIYYWGERLPGTRYYNTSLHMGDFDPGHLTDGVDLRPFVSQRDVAATLVDLEANRPAIFIDTSPADIHHWSRVPLASFPTLAAYLGKNYVKVADAGGAAIFRRR